MSDEVKVIFKTLIKVPIIILVSYFIFNIVAFVFTYFRLLGVSYVVMQTAVENNFIPESEKQTLTDYLNSLNTYVVSDLAIGCDTNTTNDASTGGPFRDINAADNDNVRVQYGTAITVSVTGNYNWVMPLVNTGKHSTTDTTHADGLEYNENHNNNILISYTVPGLHYYPDLS